MSRPLKIAAILGLAAFPLIEIGLLIRIGELIGIWRLALIIIGTALLGTYVIRRVGLSVFERALSRLGADRDGFPALFDGFLQVVAGLLLIFPGVIADSLGLVLLIPQVRKALIHTGLLKLVTMFSYHAEVHRGAFRNEHAATEDDTQGVVIEGEYERLSEKPLATGKAIQPRRARH